MRRFWLILLVLAALTATAFWGVHKLGFIVYDDPDYITANQIVQKGLTPEGLAWAFGNIRGSATYWHPITWVTHMVDCELFGLNGGAHHLVSLGFHIANVLLLFVLLSRTTGAVWTSALVAALFAVHPFQVESIAWITERKNLVSTLFALLTLLTYVKFTKQRLKRWYVLSLVLFALALMSKPAVVTIPCVMLLLDCWPLRRFSLVTTPGRFAPAQLLQSKALLLEKIPFFVLSAASAILTITAHQQLGMIAADTAPPAALNLGNIIVSYFQYLRKFFWPSDLAIFYPFPVSLAFESVGSCFFILALITLVCLLRLRRQPYLIVGWLWFLGVLVPMSGIVHVGIQAMADRFMYVPIIGLLLMLCFAAKDALSANRPLTPTLSPDGAEGEPHAASSTLLTNANRSRIAAVGAVVVVCICVILSRVQVSYWKDNLALFDHARLVTKENYMAYNVLGQIYLRKGEYVRAVTNFQTALQIQPGFSDAHFYFGQAMLSSRNFPEAIKEFEQALQLGDRYPQDVRLNLGFAYEGMGNLAAAATNYEQALRFDPNMARAHTSLGNNLLMRGRFKDALEHFRTAIALQPNSIDALGRLAWLLATHGDPAVRNGPEAVQLAEKACQLTGYAQAQPLNALAAAYAEVGKFDLAVKTEQNALEIARAKNQANLIPTTESLLKLYQSGKPYREAGQ